MKKLLSLLLSLLVLVTSLPALAADALLPKEEVLVDGKVVFNDPALQKALEADENYQSGNDMLSALRRVRKLDLTGLEEPVAEISVLQLCSSLETIYLDCAKLTSLEPLTQCKKLESLNLVNVGSLSLEPLARCKRLAKLQIDGDVADLSPLAEMRKLSAFTGLNLNAVNLAPLQEAERLRAITLDNCACDLSPLSGLKRLTNFSVRKADSAQLLAVLQAQDGALKTLELFETALSKELCTAISACKRLNELHLAFVSGVDVAALSNSASLETLLIQGVDDGCDLSALSAFPKLKYLTLTEIRGASFTGAEKLPKLKALALNLIECDDLSFVARAPKLMALTIRGCRPRDFSFLSSLSCGSTLKELNLEAVAIHDLSFVSTLPKLTSLTLVNTETADLSPLSGLKKPYTLVLYGNPVEDYRPLFTSPFQVIYLPAELPNGLVEYVQSVMIGARITTVSADQMAERHGDYAYAAAVFFGDENPRRFSERVGDNSRADQAAYDAVASEIEAMK